MAQKSGFPHWKGLCQPQTLTQTKRTQGSQYPDTPWVHRKDCTLKQKDITHEDVRCAHQTICMEHIVANVCLQKNN